MRHSISLRALTVFIAWGDTRFRAIHTGPAHTDNDIMIEVVGEDALLTGEIVRDGLLGIIVRRMRASRATSRPLTRSCAGATSQPCSRA